MIAAGSLEAAQAIELAAYDKMGKALHATGRPIVYSLCQYGFYQVWRWGDSVGGNAWRTTGDIEDKYPRAWSRSALARRASQNTPSLGTGTIRTCWRSAMAG